MNEEKQKTSIRVHFCRYSMSSSEKWRLPGSFSLEIPSPSAGGRYPAFSSTFAIGLLYLRNSRSLLNQTMIDVSMSVKVTKAKLAKSRRDEESINSI